MVTLLSLLPRSLTTFLYAVAALLRFYGNIDTTPFPRIPFTILQWSFLAFALGTASLVVNLGLEWNAGNRSRYQADQARQRETEARERETRRDDLANEERNRAAEERAKADRERDRADQERQRAASRARIQNRCFISQIRYQLAPNPDTRSALTDFLSFLQEYGEF